MSFLRKNHSVRRKIEIFVGVFRGILIFVPVLAFHSRQIQASIVQRWPNPLLELCLIFEGSTAVRTWTRKQNCVDLVRAIQRLLDRFQRDIRRQWRRLCGLQGKSPETFRGYDRNNFHLCQITRQIRFVGERTVCCNGLIFSKSDDQSIPDLSIQLICQGLVDDNLTSLGMTIGSSRALAQFPKRFITTY